MFSRTYQMGGRGMFMKKLVLIGMKTVVYHQTIHHQLQNQHFNNVLLRNACNHLYESSMRLTLADILY